LLSYWSETIAFDGEMQRPSLAENAKEAMKLMKLY
jgi:hypothetical protein